MPPTALTELDITALRTASWLEFSHASVEGAIAAHLDPTERAATPRQREVFTHEARFTRVRRLKALSAPFAYGPDGEPQSVPLRRCQYLLRGAQFSDEWQTVAALLAPGDRLSLRWMADNNNDYLRAAGLASDELRLRVVAASGARHTFLLAILACPTDSVSRMIRFS
jgi:hypothetical protein